MPLAALAAAWGWEEAAEAVSTQLKQSHHVQSHRVYLAVDPIPSLSYLRCFQAQGNSSRSDSPPVPLTCIPITA